MARLELNGIAVAYEGFALSNVTFSCDGGEIIALIGRNGAGKTTTIDAIMGLTTVHIHFRSFVWPFSGGKEWIRGG